jgi:hypothetical protein
MDTRTGLLLSIFGSFFTSLGVSAQQPTGDNPEWLSQARIAAQLEGISVGEAVRRSRLQSLAIEQADRFAKQDSDFAGSWIDRSGNTFRVIFAFKGNAQKRVSDPDLANSSQTTEVRYSRREILAERDRLGQALASHGVQVSFAVRQRDNNLLVYVSDAAKVRSLIDAGTLTIAPFVKLEDGALRETLQALIYGGGPTTGTADCAAGFTVTNGTIRGISTSGHCTPPTARTDYHRGLPIGTRQGYQLGSGIDAAWFNNPSHTYTNRVTYQSSYYTITAWAAPNVPENTVVCVIKRDGTQPCAYVYSNNLSLETSTNGPYVWMDRTITVSGDSGAPWLYNWVAYGIHKSNVCNQTGTFCGSVYTPASSLPNMGINVLINP